MGYKTHRQDLRSGGVLGPSEVRPHYAAPLELELSIHPREAASSSCGITNSTHFPLPRFPTCQDPWD